MPKPAEVFAPGEYLREEMIERGWDVPFVCKRLGLDAAELEALLAGKARMLGAMCERVGSLTGTSAALWANLEMAWRRRA